MRETWTPIAAIDVAVVDADLVWRVEHMNLLHGAVVKEYASPEEAVLALTPGHPAVIVLGPSCRAEHVRVALEARRSTVELRVVVCSIGPPVTEEDRRRLEGVDATIEMSETNGTFVRIVHDLFLAARAEYAQQDDPVSPAPAAPAAAIAPEASTPDPAVEPDGWDDGDQAQLVPVAETTEPRATPASASMFPGSAPPAPRLIVLTSAKGGEGVSTVALNLACSMATVAGTRVAIVDGDPYFGDIPTDLGERMQPMPVVWELPITDAVAEELTSQPDLEGPVVVRSPAVGGPLADAPGEVLRDVLRVASERADVVIVDVPIDLVLASNLTADAAVVALVSTRRTTSLKNTMVAAKRLDSPNVFVIFNEMDRRHRVGFVDELADELGLRLLGHLPFNAALRRSASRSRPHEVAESHTRYAREVTALRRTIVSHIPVLV